MSRAELVKAFAEGREMVFTDGRCLSHDEIARERITARGTLGPYPVEVSCYTSYWPSAADCGDFKAGVASTSVNVLLNFLG